MKKILLMLGLVPCIIQPMLIPYGSRPSLPFQNQLFAHMAASGRYSYPLGIAPIVPQGDQATVSDDSSSKLALLKGATMQIASSARDVSLKAVILVSEHPYASIALGVTGALCTVYALWRYRNYTATRASLDAVFHSAQDEAKKTARNAQDTVVGSSASMAANLTRMLTQAGVAINQAQLGAINAAAATAMLAENVVNTQEELQRVVANMLQRLTAIQTQYQRTATQNSEIADVATTAQLNALIERLSNGTIKSQRDLDAIEQTLRELGFLDLNTMS